MLSRWVGEWEWCCIIYGILACFEFHPDSTVSALFQRLPYESEWTSACALAGANTNTWPSLSWFTGPFSAERVLIFPITRDGKGKNSATDMTTNCSDLHNGRCLWRFRLFIPFELITNYNNICGLIGLSLRLMHLFPLNCEVQWFSGLQMWWAMAVLPVLLTWRRGTGHWHLKWLLNGHGMHRPGLLCGVGIKPLSVKYCGTWSTIHSHTGEFAKLNICLSSVSTE